MPTLKVIKQKGETERFSSLKFVWKRATVLLPTELKEGVGCPPALLCFVRQVRIRIWLAAAPLPGAKKQGEKGTGVGDFGTQCDLKLQRCHLGMILQHGHVIAVHGAETA